MKRGFTLVEILISIVLFSIILVFLYEVLDSNSKHNKHYEKIIDNKIDNFLLEDIVLQDFLNSEGNITISEDKNKNSLISFKSSNTYHNPFYNYITYMLVNNEDVQELVRLETKQIFKKTQINAILDSSYIDIVNKDVIKFILTKDIEQKKYMLYIEFKDKTSLLLPIIL